MSNIDQQFVEFVVKSLVSNPDDVSIDRTIDEKGVLLKLTVNPEDLGRVIGKRGVTAQSIRTLLRALGTKNDARYNLKIIDNGDPRPAPAPRIDDEDSSDEAPAEEPADKPVEEPAKEEAPAEEPVEETAPKEEEEGQSLAEKTREELAEFDDLEI